MNFKLIQAKKPGMEQGKMFKYPQTTKHQDSHAGFGFPDDNELIIRETQNTINLRDSSVPAVSSVAQEVPRSESKAAAMNHSKTKETLRRAQRDDSGTGFTTFRSY